MTSLVEAEELLERRASIIRAIIKNRREAGELAMPDSAYVKVYGVVLPSPPAPSRVGRRSQMNLIICDADHAWAFVNADRLPHDIFSRIPTDAAKALGRQLAELAERYKPTWRDHKVVASLQYGPHLT